MFGFIGIIVIERIFIFSENWSIDWLFPSAKDLGYGKPFRLPLLFKSFCQSNFHFSVLFRDQNELKNGVNYALSELLQQTSVKMDRFSILI